ncbi:Hsp20/alpha crystallin family protein [Antarcticibacterium flavum]|uniref:Hsp20/alpha crystallin family protein n=1 Tax=Antarcticibacterium flavum TaxID=2058175 RepID=A0A5B7WY32_9FLAO|nr:MULTISPECIES: Hsp20/alpha crystallin family protein [Antarcticibacterium]MCM4160852.1 heat-shock protein [Antarcticibacterium sp. W02-3]QCY68019.1 Hsp20/alpha crystallin family protein [Antarcticibacterium flavum]
MSLVKSRSRSPMMRESFMEKDPFFSDLFNRKGLLNLNKFFNEDLEKQMNLPSLNVSEKEKNYEVELAAPGYAKDDFDITIDEGILTISADKNEESKEEKDTFLRREFSYNSFTRSIGLPDNIDEDQEIKASYKDGVLKLVLAKDENEMTREPKKIKVSLRIARG